MLVVHPKDKTTAMLAALYDGLEVRLLGQSFKYSEVKDALHHTSKHGRAMMW